LPSTKWKFRNDQALWVIPKALAREPSSPAIAHLVDYFDLEFEPLWQMKPSEPGFPSSALRNGFI